MGLKRAAARDPSPGSITGIWPRFRARSFINGSAITLLRTTLLVMRSNSFASYDRGTNPKRLRLQLLGPILEFVQKQLH